MKKLINPILIIIFVIFELFLLSNSNIVINSFNKTFNNCLYNLLPTLFFSILISQILIELNIKNYIPKIIINLFKYIFNINDNDVVIYLLSILTGYPNNSKMLLDNKNLNNIILYTNFVNPIYLICCVGSIYLKNIKIVLIIFLSQILSNIIIGILVRDKNIKEINNKNDNNTNFINIYSKSIKNIVISLSIIFSNILFFSIIIALITNIIHLKEPFNSILIGLIEFSSGIYNICKLDISLFIKGLIILIIISFGSLSIHMQMISINDKIKYIKFLKYRIFNVFISVIIYLIINLII